MSQPLYNIYGVGRNYLQQGKDSAVRNVPAFPPVFSKPTHALVAAKAQEIALPRERGTIYYEAELVIRIGKPYQKGIKVDDLVDGLAVGLDLTLLDLQSKLKEKGYPWLLAKGFPNSAVISEFVPFPGIEECRRLNFALEVNGKQVQQGNIQNMINDLQEIIDYIALHFGLGAGDLIYTGTPEGAGRIQHGDHTVLLWDDRVVGECTFKLEDSV